MPHPSVFLVGRRAETARLTAALASAEGGRADSVVMTGDPGSGKTALLDLATDAARERGFHVLAGRGRGLDEDMAYAGLVTLVRPLEGMIPSLPGGLDGDISIACGLRRGRARQDRVALGFFRLLTLAAAERPVLVALDDVGWLDSATASVLRFVAGRLDADAVALLATALLPEACPFDPEEILPLGPLPPSAIAELLKADGVSSPVAHALATAVGGNPLGAIEVGRGLDDDQRRGRAPLPEIPDPGMGLLHAFGYRLESLSEAVRDALVVVAADDGGDPHVLRRAAAALGTELDVEAAERAGVLRLDGTRVRFTHPLLRAAVYYRLAPPSRRAAHRALAAALDRPEDAEARTWQLAHAADEPDEAIAVALDQVAASALGRGGPASAAAAWERAAALGRDRAIRPVRQISAAAAWLLAGSPARAAARCAEITDGHSASAEYVAREATWRAGDSARTLSEPPDCPPGAVARLAADRRELRHGDEALMGGRVDEAVVSWRAIASAPPSPIAVAARLRLAEVAELKGDAQRALAELDATGTRDVDDAVAAMAGRIERAAGWAGSDGPPASDHPREGAPAWTAGTQLLLSGRPHEAIGALRMALSITTAPWAAARVAGDLADAFLCTDRRSDAARLAERVGHDAGPFGDALTARIALAAGTWTDPPPLIVEELPAERARWDLTTALVRRTDRHASSPVAMAAAAAACAGVGLRGWAGFATALSAAAPVADPLASLSAAEHRVALSVGRGRSNREAATELYLSVKTVDFHLQQIYRKLGLRSRVQLAGLVARSPSWEG